MRYGAFGKKTKTKSKKLTLDVRDRPIELPDVPLEVNLVRFRPREYALTPKLRLVDDEEVQDACQVLDLIRTVVKNTNPCKAC